MKSLKNIYFVQAGGLFGVNAYFPYAAGCIAAYAWNNPIVRENYRLGHFTFLRTPLAQVIESFEEPYMVAFSNYVWNFEYHKALARAVKERWPGCLILFGGHQVLNDSAAQLDEYPFIDFLVHKAREIPVGEISFEQLLLALHRGAGLGRVPSLSYRDAGGNVLRTAEAECSGCDLVSPYLTGLFDGLFEEYPELLFSMTIETNRGCPYGCAFCDWGLVRHGLYLMPMERVKAEIDWAARHKIEFIFCADGNFGLMERDEEIVDTVIESKRRTGYPTKFNAAFAKNSDETVFRLNQKLCAHGLNSGATLALQSLLPAALESVGRKNLGFERFRELISLYSQANVPVYTDLIIGLPGETLGSFTGGIGALLAAGMHGSLEVLPCELLPNAEMSSPSFREKYGIKSVRVRQYQKYISKKNQGGIPEYSEIVCQTNTMPAEDWVAAYLFSAVVQGFHGLGLLPYIAIYLYWERQLPYERFYLGLMEYAKENPSTLMGELLSLIEGRYWAFLEGKGENIVYYDRRFGDVAWQLSSALFLCAAYESDRFYGELPAFLRQYRIDGDLEAQLLRYQRVMLCLPGPPPSRQAFGYDFPGYFNAAFTGRPPALQSKRASVRFPARETSHSWVDFARDYVWYGRRKGALTRKEYEVIYE